MASKEATDLSTQTPTEKYSSWNSSDPSEETNVTLSDSYITTVSYSSLGSHFERPENAHLYALQPGLRTVWSRSVQDFASEESAIQRTTRSHSLEHNLNKRVPSVPNVFQGRDITLRTHQNMGQSAPIQSETPLYKQVEQTQIDSNKKAPFSKVALPVQRIKAVKHCGELFEATYLPIEVLRRDEKLLAKWEPASYQPVLSVMYLYGQKMRCDLPILEPIFAAPASLSTVHGHGRDTREPPPCDRESDTRIRLRKLEKELEAARHRALIPSITSGSAYSRRAQGRKFKEVYHVLGDDHLTDSNVVDMFKEVYGDSALSSQSSCSSSTLRPSRIPVLPLPQGTRNNTRSMHHYRARGQLRVAAGGDAITSPNYDSSLCATFDVDDEFTDLAHLNSDCNWDEENSPVKHSNKNNLARVHEVRPHTEAHRLCGLERHMDTTQGRTTNGTFTHSTNLPTTDTLSYSSNPSPVSRDVPHFQMPPRRHTIGNQMDKCEIPRNVGEGVRVANFAGLSSIPQLSSKQADVVINPSNINIKEHERRTEMPSSIVRCVPTKALLSAINGDGDPEELKNTKDAEFRVGECFDEEGDFLSDSDADTASTSETITPYQTDATEALSGTYSTRTGMMREQIAEALQQMNLPEYEGRESRLHTSQSVSTHYSLMRSFGGQDGEEDDLMVRSLDHLNYESETLRTMPHVDVSAIPYLMHSLHHSMDSVYPAQSFFMNKFPSASVPCLSVSDAPRASLEHSDTLHRIPQANLYADVYEGSIWESQNTESLRSPMYGTRTRKCKSMDSVLASDMKGKSGAVCSVSEVFDTIMLEDQMKKQEAWDADEQIFSYKDGRSLEGTSKKGKFNNYFSMLIFKIFPAWFRMLSCRSRRARPQTDSDAESVDS